jgi:hypothetical protein
MTQRDVVIVPTFDRPEWLWVCLEYIAAAKPAESTIIQVYEDIRTDKPKGFTIEMEMLATIRYFEKVFGKQFRYCATSPHSRYGNSYNLLSALHEATLCETRLVYIIEDDVLITRDFFRWNEAVFEQKLTPWVACAGRLNRSLNFESNGRYEMDEAIKDLTMCKSVVGAYNSWATCFPRQSLEQFFGWFDWKTEFKPGIEQDMIIQDYMRKNKLVSTWPYVPRAFHTGWNSYHRSGLSLYGTLEERISALRKIVTNKSKIQEMAGLSEMDPFVDVERQP